MDDVIRPEKAKEFDTSHGRFGAIGRVKMQFNHGIATVEDAPSLTVMDMRDDDGHSVSAAIAVYDPEPGRGHGYLVQMSADGARSLAAALLRIADMISPPHLNG